MNKKEFFDKLIALQNSDRYEAFRAEERNVSDELTPNFSCDDFAWYFRAIKEGVAMQTFKGGDPTRIRAYLKLHRSCICEDHWQEIIAAIGQATPKKRGRKSGNRISGRGSKKTTQDVALGVYAKLCCGLKVGKAIEEAAIEFGMGVSAVKAIYYSLGSIPVINLNEKFQI